MVKASPMKRKTIVCVTPNAALDRTLVVPDFAIGHISRIPNAIAAPGGKGLNVLRAVRILGGQSLAMGLLGGYTGETVAAMVEADGYPSEWTGFDGETRACTIIASGGASTVINESGRIAPEDWAALADDICRVAARPDVYAICLCGSLPEGAPSDAPAEFVARVNRMGAQLWVDSSKGPLKNALAAKPYAIKVNRDEIAEAAGVSLRTRAEVLDLARGLVDDGIGIVVISLGAEGAFLVADGLAAQATPPVIEPVDPVASGDCLHAGLITALADGADPVEALRRGVAAGTVNALYAGGAQFPYAHFLEILNQTRAKILTA